MDDNSGSFGKIYLIIYNHDIPNLVLNVIDTIVDIN